MDGDDPQDPGEDRPAVGDAAVRAEEPDDPAEVEGEAAVLGAGAWRWL